MHTYYEATPRMSLSGALICGGTCLQKTKELTMTVEGQRDGSLDTGSTPVYSTSDQNSIFLSMRYLRGSDVWIEERLSMTVLPGK